MSPGLNVPPFPHAGDGDGAEVKTSGCCPRGSKFLEGGEDLALEGAPLKGASGQRRPGKSVGGSRPLPAAGTVPVLLVRGQPAWNAARPVALPPTSAQGIWPTPGFY